MEILNRFTGEVMLEIETLIQANLYEFNLSGANLYEFNLSGANLYRANLSGANLYRASLSGANLSGANLYRASLSGANLSGASLSGADLSESNLSGAVFKNTIVLGHEVNKTPIQINGLHWRILITEHDMQIGCKTYSHEKWQDFSDEKIDKMDPVALTFWRLNKTFLIQCCLNQSIGV